jgi:hypothetical protein
MNFVISVFDLDFMSAFVHSLQYYLFIVMESFYIQVSDIQYICNDVTLHCLLSFLFQMHFCCSFQKFTEGQCHRRATCDNSLSAYKHFLSCCPW